MSLVVCQNVTKKFKVRGGCKVVLNRVNLSLDKGETALITGRNGAGKSVFLSLVSGLDRPSGGEICWRNRRYSDLSNHQLSRLRACEIGMIFQNHNLIPSWTALENVEAGMIHMSCSHRKRRDAAMEWLSEAGLQDKMDELPHQLSMGEQQRVAVVRTLIRKPQLVLADEPTGDLDEETAQVIVQMLTRAVRENQSSFLIATHGNFPTSFNAKYIMQLRDGMLVPE